LTEGRALFVNHVACGSERQSATSFCIERGLIPVPFDYAERDRIHVKLRCGPHLADSPPGLIHHSDRGGQYTSRQYRERLAEHGVRGSMSRRGNPYDNATMESLIKTLKCEEIYPREYTTVEDVIINLPHVIEELYNRRRLHSSLGYHPPEEFERLAHSTCRLGRIVDPRLSSLQGVTPGFVRFQAAVDSASSWTAPRDSPR